MPVITASGTQAHCTQAGSGSVRATGNGANDGTSTAILAVAAQAHGTQASTQAAVPLQCSTQPDATGTVTALPGPLAVGQWHSDSCQWHTGTASGIGSLTPSRSDGTGIIVPLAVTASAAVALPVAQWPQWKCRWAPPPGSTSSTAATTLPVARSIVLRTTTTSTAATTTVSSSILLSILQL